MLSLVRLRRVALVQALVVTLTIVLCVMAVLRYENGKQRLYEAKARIAISQTYAKSAAEADAVVAQARALATSRAIVAEATRSANANRDVDSVARKTTLSSLGTSPIAQLTVRDRDPRIAARLANGIAGAVVSYLQDAARGQVPALVHQLNVQLQQLTSQYELLLTDPNAPVEQIAAVSSQMSNVQQQLLTLRANDAQQLQPSVIDKASVPTHAVASSATQDGALAGLVGLVLGVAIVAAWAALRPMVVGGADIAAALDTSYLGRFDVNRAEQGPEGAATIARIVARARRLESSTVMIVGARSGLDTQRLAEELNQAVAQYAANRRPGLGADQGMRRSLGRMVRFAGSDPSSVADSAWADQRVAVVGFVTETSARASLRRIHEVADSAGWPLAGVVTYARRRASAASRQTAEPTGETEPTGELASRPDEQPDSTAAFDIENAGPASAPKTGATGLRRSRPLRQTQMTAGPRVAGERNQVPPESVAVVPQSNNEAEEVPCR